MQADELGFEIPKPVAQVFEGKYNQKMSELISAGFVPWNPSQIMEARVNSIGSERESALWDNYFDSDFGLAATKDKVYLFSDSDSLRNINPQSKLINGGIFVATDYFTAQDQNFFERKSLESSLNGSLTQDEVINHPLWKIIAGNEELLGQYTEAAFKQGKDKFGYDKMMGIYVPTDSKPILRSLVLDRLVDRSDADGKYWHLDSNTRLVGVRAEGATPNFERKLENIVK